MTFLDTHILYAGPLQWCKYFSTLVYWFSERKYAGWWVTCGSGEKHGGPLWAAPFWRSSIVTSWRPDRRMPCHFGCSVNTQKIGMELCRHCACARCHVVKYRPITANPRIESCRYTPAEWHHETPTGEWLVTLALMRTRRNRYGVCAQ